MTWRAHLQGIIRSWIMNSLVAGVVSDISTNGLSVADEAIIDAYLDTTMP